MHADTAALTTTFSPEQRHVQAHASIMRSPEARTSAINTESVLCQCISGEMECLQKLNEHSQANGSSTHSTNVQYNALLQLTETAMNLQENAVKEAALAGLEAPAASQHVAETLATAGLLLELSKFCGHTASALATCGEYCPPRQRQIRLNTSRIQAATAALKQWTWLLKAFNPDHVMQHTQLAPTVQPMVRLQAELLRIWQVMAKDQAASSSNSNSSSGIVRNRSTNKKKKKHQRSAQANSNINSSLTAAAVTVMTDAMKHVLANAIHLVAGLRNTAAPLEPNKETLLYIGSPDLLLLFSVCLAHQAQCLHYTRLQTNCSLANSGDSSSDSDSSSPDQQLASFAGLYAALGFADHAVYTQPSDFTWELGPSHAACVAAQALGEVLTCCLLAKVPVPAAVPQLLSQLAMPLLHVLTELPLLPHAICEHNAVLVSGACFETMNVLIAYWYAVEDQSLVGVLRPFCRQLMSGIAPKVMQDLAPAVVQLLRLSPLGGGSSQQSISEPEDMQAWEWFLEQWANLTLKIASTPFYYGGFFDFYMTTAAAAQAFWQHPTACAAALEAGARIVVRDNASDLLLELVDFIAMVKDMLEWEHYQAACERQHGADPASAGSISSRVISAAPPLYALIISCMKLVASTWQEHTSSSSSSSSTDDTNTAHCCHNDRANSSSDNISMTNSSSSNNCSSSSTQYSVTESEYQAEAAAVLVRCVLSFFRVVDIHIKLLNAITVSSGSDGSRNSINKISSNSGNSSTGLCSATSSASLGSRARRIRDAHALKAVLAARALLLLGGIILHTSCQKPDTSNGAASTTAATGALPTYASGAKFVHAAKQIAELLGAAIPAATAEVDSKLGAFIKQLLQQQQSLLLSLSAAAAAAAAVKHSMSTSSTNKPATNNEASVTDRSAEAAVSAAQPSQINLGFISDMQQFAEAVISGLPLCYCCNNPYCTNLSGNSELLLAKAAGSRCSGCKQCFYCSRNCQCAHWGQHRRVCKLLKAAVAGNS